MRRGKEEEGEGEKGVVIPPVDYRLHPFLLAWSQRTVPYLPNNTLSLAL